MFPHIKRIDLHNDGTVHEVLVMQELDNGDLYFIRIDYLDEIDRNRMRTILSKRDAAKYPLWDLLDQTTLPNGVNALVFFQQFVKVRSASGKIFNPGQGRMGMRPVLAPTAQAQAQQAAGRGPGRPPKATAEGEAPKG